MIDEPVYLEKHDPLWGEYFERERERIKIALALDSTAIEHIGSTAISGIYAKPVVDITIGVEIFPPPQYLSDRLINLGYEALGEAGVPERIYFRYRGWISFNVHVVRRDGQHWKSNLALRDYLRSHPEEAKRYEIVKITAVRSGASSLLTYSAAKSAIIDELVSRSLAWQATISQSDRIL